MAVVSEASLTNVPNANASVLPMPTVEPQVVVVSNHQPQQPQQLQHGNVASASSGGGNATSLTTVPSSNTIVNVTITNTPNGVKTEIVTTSSSGNVVMGCGAVDGVGVVPIKMETTTTSDTDGSDVVMSNAAVMPAKQPFIDTVLVTGGNDGGLSIG